MNHNGVRFVLRERYVVKRTAKIVANPRMYSASYTMMSLIFGEIEATTTLSLRSTRPSHENMMNMLLI